MSPSLGIEPMAYHLLVKVLEKFCCSHTTFSNDIVSAETSSASALEYLTLSMIVEIELQ